MNPEEKGRALNPADDNKLQENYTTEPALKASFSMFRNSFDTEPAGVTTLAQLAADTRGGRWQAQVEQLRAMNAEEYSQNKRNLEAAAFGGTFTRRARRALAKASGLVVIDIDHVEGAELATIKARLMADRHTALCFVSPSGKGLKAVFVADFVDDATFKQAWRAIANYLKDSYSLNIDESGKNIDRLCYVSYDPEAYYNPDAVQFVYGVAAVEPKAKPEAQHNQFIASLLSVERENIVNADRGKGNEALNNAALKLAHYYNTGLFEKEEVKQTFRRAYLARAGSPKTEAEFNSTFESGFSAGLADQREIPAPWPEIQPFCERLEQEEYPINALPESIRAAVDEVLSFTQAPAAMVASCALSAVSLAIQGHVDVSRSPKLSGPTSLYILVIAESGERKTTVDDYFKPAFADYEASEREKLKPEIAKFRADLESWEAEKAGIKDKIRQLAKDGKDVSVLKDRLREIEARKPQEIQIPRIVYRDITAEKLAENLSKNRPSAGIISDEAGSVFGSHSMQPENCMKTLGMYNTLWGSGPLTLDRKTASSAIVESARLTISLQVQEITMRDFLEKAGAIARGSGFLARFLIAWPESTQGNRLWKDEPQSWPCLDSFTERIHRFLKKVLPRSTDGVLEPVKMIFSEEARELWIQYYDGVEQSLRAGSEMGEIRDVASKSAENAARLAACFEAFENENETTISAKSMQSAIQIAYWHLTESRRFLGEIALPENKLNALRLERWLKSRCMELNVDRLKKSDTMQRGPLRDKEHLDPALELLRERGRARLITADNTKFILMNPVLLDMGVHE